MGREHVGMYYIPTLGWLPLQWLKVFISLNCVSNAMKWSLLCPFSGLAGKEEKAEFEPGFV